MFVSQPPPRRRQFALTSAELSYGNKAVQDLWDKVRFVANGGLAVVTVWGGVNFMTFSTDTVRRRPGHCRRSHGVLSTKSSWPRLFVN
jgi:hypothetical protein